MPQQITLILASLGTAAIIGLIVLWVRKPVFRWYCRRCKKIASTGRFRPSKCGCGSQTLVAYFCKDCHSWNTTPTPQWHCAACSSKDISLGVEYALGTGMWRTRNTNT